jgi:hypothetical protein
MPIFLWVIYPFVLWSACVEASLPPVTVKPTLNKPQ